MAPPAGLKRRVLLLLAGGVLVHLISTASVYALGRLHIFPNLILPNGALRGDSANYLERSIALGRSISMQSTGGEQIHVRLYAISSAVLTPIVGANIFSVELIAMPLYVLGLFLVYKIGAISFDARSGLVAGVMVGLLPTFLLHQTQPLRDPLFIVLLLTFLWLMLRLLMTPVSVMAGFLCAVGGWVALLLLWLVRDNLWPLYTGITGLAFISLVVISTKNRRASLSNFGCLLLLMLALGLIPRFFAGWVPPKEPMTVNQTLALDQFTQRQTQAGQTGIPLKIEVIRQKFVILYESAGSNIDADRQLYTRTEILAYLPRALMIGLFAPFPADWFKRGEVVGRFGRIITGLETGIIYLLCPFVVVSVWRTRRAVHVWYLLSVVLLGSVALGLVVVNLGALYRIRYAFWIIFIILGTSYLSNFVTWQRVMGAAKK